MSDSVELCAKFYQFRKKKPTGFGVGESRGDCRESVIADIIQSIAKFQYDTEIGLRMMEEARARCAQLAFMSVHNDFHLVMRVEEKH